MHINLFILSEDPVALAGLVALVQQDDRINLIGTAVDGSAGLRCLEDTTVQPDVVVIGEPQSERALCRNVQRLASRSGQGTAVEPRFVVVSQRDYDDVVIPALRLGVNGYLARIGSPDELWQSLQIVARGGAAFSPAIAARFSEYFSSVRGLQEPTEFGRLTVREREILGLLAEGASNRQIARALFLAEKTVRNYVSRIFTKLEVSDRTEALLRARDAGLGERPTAAPAPEPSRGGVRSG
ncbi:LuxR C-terminal-related transcriptional regulator [Streptomyces zingiberis]|uniref:Response regulator transcription factor n=1 Tax=Streptomyces zingiberis TaxID=2053010 RepID=A0ABX1C0Y2_9ACTN|nr:response regulator transcription factor [Streptomyces zingiberis]NJQ01254.1 response regulator transcription factor [Streptomyces zingiberis]